MKKWTTILLAGLIFLAPAGAAASAITFSGSNLGFEALITDLGGGSLQWDFDSIASSSFSIKASYSATDVTLSYPGDLSLSVGGQFANNPFSGVFSVSSLLDDPDPFLPTLFSGFGPDFDGNISFDFTTHKLEVTKGIGVLSDSLLTSLSFVEPPGFIGAFYVSAMFDFEFTGIDFIEFIDSGKEFEGTMNSFTLTATPVPESGTMMLLGSGLVGLAGWGRKRIRG